MPDSILATQAVVLGVTQDARQKMAEKFLRRRQIEELTGLARSTIYDRIKAGTFPKPVKIGDRAVAWLKSDIDAWQSDCIAKAQA